MLIPTVPALLKDFTIMVPLGFSISRRIFVLLFSHWVWDALSLGVKRPEHEVEISAPPIAEIKNA
jgi:hypothetical protein